MALVLESIYILKRMTRRLLAVVDLNDGLFRCRYQYLPSVLLPTEKLTESDIFFLFVIIVTNRLLDQFIARSNNQKVGNSRVFPAASATIGLIVDSMR